MKGTGEPLFRLPRSLGMKRPRFIALFGAFGAITLLTVAVGSRGRALACTPTPDYDPYAGHPIVEGRLVETPGGLYLRVYRVYGGTLPWLIRFRTGNASSACGLADIVGPGDHVILGLSVQDGVAGGSWPNLFYCGTDPESAEYSRALAEIRMRVGDGHPPAFRFHGAHWFDSW